MPGRFRISLLSQDERAQRGEYEPNLRISIREPNQKPLALERLPREIRDHIYRYVLVDMVDHCVTAQLTAAEVSGIGGSGVDMLHNEVDAASLQETQQRSKKMRTAFETDFVVRANKPMWLHRLPPVLLAEVEQFIYNECTIMLDCAEALYPRDKKVLSRGLRLVVNYRGRPSVFAENVVPLLKKRLNLKYIHINFTVWPGSLQASGENAGSLLRNKMNFLKKIKASNVVLNVCLTDSWKHAVLLRLADHMMGTIEAEAKEVPAEPDVIRPRMSSERVTRDSAVGKKRPRTGQGQTYRRVLGRAGGIKVGSKFGIF